MLIIWIRLLFYKGQIKIAINENQELRNLQVVKEIEGFGSSKVITLLTVLVHNFLLHLLYQKLHPVHKKELDNKNNG